MAKDEGKGKGGNSPRASKQSKEVTAVDGNIKTQVEAVLIERSDSTCTHPNFEQVDSNSQIFGIEAYWSRKHAGVKIGERYCHKKAAKGNKYRAAYFGCRSNCPYSTLLLANLYVSCLDMSQ